MSRGAATRWGKVEIMKGLVRVCEEKCASSYFLADTTILILKEPAQAGK